MKGYQTQGLPAIVVSGEKKGNRVDFGNSFDPNYSTTEGQFRALFMKLNRLIGLDQFSFQSQYEIDGNETVYFTADDAVNKTVVYAVILKSGTFDESLKRSIDVVTNRGSVYTAKDFYEELVDHRLQEVSSSEVDDMTYPQAVELFSNLSPTEDNIDMINKVVQTLAVRQIQRNDELFDNIVNLLSNIPDDVNCDIILNATYKIANQYFESNIFDKAWEIYILISDQAKVAERLSLMISTRLKAAQIAKELHQDYNAILEMLEGIDDGSLEVATQDEREQYYSMQGYCYDQMGEKQMAEDFHYMAVMIAESETSPSIFVAESHAFLGRIAAEKYQPEVATREYLTASTIAMANNDRHLNTIYSHKAALSEIYWAKLLASTAVIMNINSDPQNAEFYAWQSLKRLVNSISHSDRTLRKQDILEDGREVIDMNKEILSRSSEYAQQTISELDNQLRFIADGVLPVDQESELLKFITTKISAMIPLPPPVILLIAPDGRLILGGKIGSDKWDQSILANDDLFSGALSAIMAILSEVMTGDNPLRMLDAGQTQIMIEKSKFCIGALLVDRDLNILRKALKNSVEMMERQYPGLEDWDGYSIDFSGAKPKIESIFGNALENIAS